MGLRDRREERRDERQTFGRGGDAVRYQLRQKMFSIGDDYWIENDRGERVFKVNGKAMRLRDTFDLEDAQGNVLCRIQEKAIAIRDSMSIEGPDGQKLAVIHKALISPLRERYKVDRGESPEWEVQGNIVDHEYEIEEGGRKVAEVSKKWFRMRDTYGIQVAPGEEQFLAMAVTVAIDAMAHPRD